MAAVLRNDRERGDWYRRRADRGSTARQPRAVTRRRAWQQATSRGATRCGRRRGRIGNGNEILDRQVRRDIGRRQLTGQLAQGQLDDLSWTGPVGGLLGGIGLSELKP